MPLLRQWENDGAKFGIWKMDERIAELRSRLVASYPYDEELSCLKAESRKLEYLSVRALLKELSGHELLISHHPSGKPFVVEEINGRPLVGAGRVPARSRVPARKSPLQISISHTKGYAAVGVYPSFTSSPVGAGRVSARNTPTVGATLAVARPQTLEIGIDIERISERVRRASIRFIRDDEIPGFSDMDSEEQLLQLLVHWSAKETMFKMLNAEGVDFQEHLRIMPFRLEQKGIIHGLAFSDKRFEINYVIEKDFVLTYSIHE